MPQIEPEKMEDFKERVDQFHMMQLPGQPMMMHMGTSHLVSDLWAALRQLNEASK